MSDPVMIEGIKDTVSIPVMAKVRIGHFVEAQILQALGVDFIDESEVLTPADEANHRVDQRLQTEPLRQGRDDYQPGVGDKVRVVEGRVNPVDRLRYSRHWKCLLELLADVA